MIINIYLLLIAAATIRYYLSHHRRWGILAIALSALALCKAYAWPYQFSMWARRFAREKGWYHLRIDVQVIANGVILIIALMITGWLVLRLWRAAPQMLPALVGALLLTLLMAGEAISLHALDNVLWTPCLGSNIRNLIHYLSFGLIGISLLTLSEVTLSDSEAHR